MESPIAEVTAPVDAPEADAEGAEAGSEGSAPSAPKAGTSEETSDWTEKAQKRYHELTRERYDALRERDIERYEKEQLKARLDALEKAKTEPVAPEQFPTLEQYGYDEAKFVAAVATYNKATTESARAAAREEAQAIIKAEREQAQLHEATKNWAKKEAEFIKSKPDYVEKVLEAPTLPISREMQMELRESELGPQIAYYLVENPDKAAAIMAMPLKAQLKEIGRIEAKLESIKTPAKPAVSQAPPPVGKIEADDVAPVVRVDSADSDSLSDKEWTRRRNAQEQARLRKQRGG